MREINPVWIKFYTDKRIQILRKLDGLDRDDRAYWKKRLRLNNELIRINTKLGIK